jgi:hypothetical protein
VATRGSSRPVRAVGLCAALLLAGLNLVHGAPAGDWLAAWRATNAHWRGVHFWLRDDGSARELLQVYPKLAALGVNSVILEVNHRFAFAQHPDLRERRFITAARARELTAAARTNGIRLIPQFNCLGHQSFGRQPVPLLVKYPEFNETPGVSAAATNVYCLSWCPKAPGLTNIVFSLIDDLITGFDADAFHVGMDEVYFIASDKCPRCRGDDPARTFARVVNELHRHIVGERKVEMLMWADRVIGPKYQGRSQYDNERNDTSASIDLIPRDVVMCDWHYEWRREYASVPYLLRQGFRVWPAGFMPASASQAFSHQVRTNPHPRLLGYLCTTWNQTRIADAAEWPPIRDVLREWKSP